MNAIDVSLYPVFKDQTLSMIAELDAIYRSREDAGLKANKFHTVLKKYECLS